MSNFVLRKARGELLATLPPDLGAAVGNIIVAYATLEHRLTALTTVLLQLNNAEARVALRMPRAVERLDMALDLLAVKKIDPGFDETALRNKVEEATSVRDLVAHGIWVKHPTEPTIFVQRSRGTWPREMMSGERIKRSLFPQALPYGVPEAMAALSIVQTALEAANALGGVIDKALESYPHKFHEPLPVMNPLGRRRSKGKPRQP